MDTDLYTNWLEIDLEALRNNIRQFLSITARPVMAVVKANAYGHGMIESARAALEAGATWLGVARMEEALALRQAGFLARILVLGYTVPGRAAEAARENITLTVTAPEIGQAYSAACAGMGRRVSVHAKIDSGMGRLGVLAEDGAEFVLGLLEEPGLDLEGVYTHFARADEPGRPTTDDQMARFTGVIDALQAAGRRPRLVHAANSAASLYRPDSYFDLVRPGIAIYGLNPSPDAPVPAGFVAVLSWKTRLTSVKLLPAGHGVSYGHRYTTPAVQRIGALAVGYADGLRRKLDANSCLVGGRRLPVLGTVCMDQVMVPLDELPGARVGDEVVLIGRQGEAQISADDLAAAWGTINYEVTCGLAARVPRFYRN